MNRSPAPILPDRVLSAAAVDKLGQRISICVSGGSLRVLGSAPFHALESRFGDGRGLPWAPRAHETPGRPIGIATNAHIVRFVSRPSARASICAAPCSSHGQIAPNIFAGFWLKRTGRSPLDNLQSLL